MSASENRPIVWSVAGSDSGGGAGLQADLRAFDAFHTHGCTAVAAITAQNSVAVTRVEPVSAELLDAQLAALAGDLPPRAIKTGLLGSVENVRTLARHVDALRERGPVALVVDPVLRSTTGAAFADEALVAAYREWLLPRATLLTPNQAEAAALLGGAVLSPRDAADVLHRSCGAAVAVTGGDAGGTESADWIVTRHASGALRLPRIDTPHHHGSGCTFAALAAAALAHGFVAAEALVLAKMGTAEALRRGDAAGQGAGPVRAAAGFAQRLENLPHLDLPGGAAAPCGFAPLADPALGLYAVVDSADWVFRLLELGVRTLQLRVKSPDAAGLSEDIRRCVEASRAAGAQFFVNDHWRLAIEHGAYGVHLGQEDLATADLAAIRDAGLRLGVSTHSYWEVCRAWALRPSYLACGPIHATASKDMPWIPQGEGNLAYWSRLLPVPVVGIAGMNEARVREAARCGAASAAVITAITQAPDPAAAVHSLSAAFAEGREQAPRPAPAWARPTLAPSAGSRAA
ncbi:bifunctional hydroxymethylpyrimidine kinase/phosphomethylpyrimidine kinase [Caldimonas tepidiphila]|uniref:bifunctional hydroxymethylpyrimidine kinase/phosphomethylpyrimidine kinase n=1 Tax=Caldimonas tepidiphila TaxID=2315841 RepID=UPI000E5BAFF0|nr:bifunctional hydroxymethylpyrimidine kinase/phosphomethylpyrimidine kinase [Caldimonas tepidiphila]